MWLVVSNQAARQSTGAALLPGSKSRNLSEFQKQPEKRKKFACLSESDSLCVNEVYNNIFNPPNDRVLKGSD